MTARRSDRPGRRSGHRGSLASRLVAGAIGLVCGAAGTAVVLLAQAGPGSAAPAVPAAQRQTRPQAAEIAPAPEPLVAAPERPRPQAGKAKAGAGSAPATSSPPSKRCTVDRLLVPSCGAWWGAAVSEFPQTTGLRNFERKIGRPVDIYHNYYAGRKIFPSRTDFAIAREPGRNRMLLLSWKPDSGGITWAQVARGAMDDHIDRLSAHFKTFPERFWLVIHHEPENEIIDRPGSGFTAVDYRNMFRHVVQRFRANGVQNAVYTMMYMAYSGYVVKPWFKQLYPGNDVVDWIGYDAYAFSTTKTFSQLVNQAAPNEQRLGLEGFYTWAQRNLSDDKPMMLGEWGGTELSGDPTDKADLFRSVAREIKRFPALKALVYWDHPNGNKFGDTRIDTSPQALHAYRSISALTYFNQSVPTR